MTTKLIKKVKLVKVPKLVKKQSVRVKVKHPKVGVSTKMRTFKRGKFLNEKGSYDYYAFPGGYPIFYVTKDSAALCPECANKNKKLTFDQHDSQWFIVAADVNYEDENLYCDHCNKKIESAYGED